LLGAGGAANWRNTGSGSDAFGTTGQTYFNNGRYAVNVLASSNATPTPTPAPATSDVAIQAVQFNGFGS
jgi:hypothetical protein